MNSENQFRNRIRELLNSISENEEIEEGFSRIDVICEEINRLENFEAIWKNGIWEISE